MFAKLWTLLEPLKNWKHKGTLLKVALASVVLGLGGVAVYKGAQQMKPKRPAPKPMVTAANKINQKSRPGPKPSVAPVRVVSGQISDDNSADSLYAAGIEQSPAADDQGDNLYPQYSQDNQAAPSEYGSPSYSGIPASPMSGQSGSGTYGANPQSELADDNAAPIVPPNRIRSLPTSPGGYGAADEGEPQTLAGDTRADNGLGANTGAGPVNSYGETSVETTVDSSSSAPGTAGTQGTYPDGSLATEGVSDDPGYGVTDDEAISNEVGSAVAPQTLPGIDGRTQPALSNSPPPGRSLRGSAAGVAQPLGMAATGGGTPGDRQLEGTQVPSIAIEKFAPAEIQVGKAATLEIRVRNSGQSAAHDVLVTDQVPRGTRLESTSPEAQLAADGSLAWQLGEMQPGDEVVLSMQVLPEQEGEIGSVAHVVFSGRATARSVCTRPLLAIEHTAPKQVLIGETVSLAIAINNPGTGAATGVIVEEDVPAGLTHVAGSELEYEIGTLRPGESRQLQLQLTADKPGLIENTVTVRGEGNLIAQHQVLIEVIAPQLAVEVTGPKIRYLDRQATYTLAIANPGTAAARSVELVAYLPKGLKFQSTDAEGQYDAAQHAVFWSLEELPANKSGSVNLVAVPIETGEQMLRVEGKADLGLTATSQQAVQVEARSELEFDIVDVNDPIEVGTETVYEIRVVNKGTRPATSVEVAAGLPPAIKPVSAEGHSRGEVQGQQVLFEPVGRINPGEEVKFRIHAQGTAEGDHVIAVQIKSAEFQTPVTREESTRVYIDR